MQMIKRNHGYPKTLLLHSIHSGPPDVPLAEFQNQPLDPLMSSNCFQTTPRYCRQRPEAEIKDCDTAREVQKADLEKLSRDRLNEQFLELGNALGS